MLLWGCLLLLLLLLIVTSLGCVLLWGLSLVGVLLVATVTGTTTHHGSNTLVSDLTAGSESHTCRHGTHEATSSKSHTG